MQANNAHCRGSVAARFVPERVRSLRPAAGIVPSTEGKTALVRSQRENVRRRRRLDGLERRRLRHDLLKHGLRCALATPRRWRKRRCPRVRFDRLRIGQGAVRPRTFPPQSEIVAPRGNAQIFQTAGGALALEGGGSGDNFKSSSAALIRSDLLEPELASIACR